MPSSSDRESFWRRVIAESEVSNLTIDEVCLRAGVSRASFFHWRKRLQAIDVRAASTNDAPPASKNGSPLVPVRIVDDRVLEITLELPGGVCIRVPPGCDGPTLSVVLRTVATLYRDDASC